MFDVSEIIARMEDLTRKMEDQSHQIKDQSVKIEDQNRQIENLTQELNLTKTTLYANVLIQNEETQRFIDRTNSLVESIKQNEGFTLNWLFDCLVRDLRKYCEDNIPMASGKYLPHHEYKSLIESAHEGSHLAEHLVHDFTKVAVQYLPSVKEVLSVTGLVMHQVPILGFALAVFDIISTHQAIHKAKHTMDKLSNFSEGQRNTLYTYVMASTMLLLATRITTNTLIHHSVAQEHPLSVAKEHSLSEKLLQWYALLLAESISSLEALPSLEGLPKDIPSLQVFATHWCESIAQKFLQPGVDMLNSLQVREDNRYSLEELKVAFEIQQIFTQPNRKSSHSYLHKRLTGTFRDPFHEELYNKVLMPYKNYAIEFTAFFTGYLLVIETLQKWQSRYIHALDTVQKDLLPDSLNFDLQLNLINTSLFGNLQKMCSDMPWHKAANRLFLKMSNKNLFEGIREPLTVLASNEHVRIISRAALLGAANARADRVEKEHTQTKGEHAQTKWKHKQTKWEHEQTKWEHEQTKGEHAQTKWEHEQTKKQLEQTENKLEQTENKLEQTEQENINIKAELKNIKAELKRANNRIASLTGVSTSQQSPLIGNSLFKASVEANIIESDKAGCSNNSTLQ